MHSQYGWSIAAQLKWREKTMVAKESTSVYVTGWRGAFFYLWKGVKEYESEIHLPQLWDTLGL